nr:MAG TPA: hypothetical protein [Caudoviricetes sp.]
MVFYLFLLYKYLYLQCRIALLITNPCRLDG